MNRPIHASCILFLLLGLLAQGKAGAYHFRLFVDLSTGKDALQNPFVHSFASAELFHTDSTGTRRIYDIECIMGHGVSDITSGYDIFTARIINSNGYLNSTTRDSTGQDMIVEPNHCYGATVAAHANKYNVHQRLDSESACTPPTIQKPEKYTPVLLDLETDGFHLSGPNPPVSFDLNADGTPERTAWTRAGEDEAFLCMDRNGNGLIDDGRELFGSATPLLSGGTDESGYSALTELDWPVAGGNSDGTVNSSDAMFSRLCVWVDANRDGVSQRREIRSADQAGVVGFAAGYKTMHKKDDFGNLFRYTSRVYMRSSGGGVTSWPTFDVIFAVP